MTTFTSTPWSPPLSREESRGLVGRTMALVSLTAAEFAAGAYLGRHAGGGWAFLLFLAAFATLFAIQAAVQRSEELAVALLLLFGLLLGLASASTIAYYAESDPQAVWEAGLATALFIAGFGAAGYATKRDLSGLARTLLWALVGLIGLGIVLIFVQIPGGVLVYAIAGLVIFAGLTALDFQRLRRIEDIRSAPLLAASIFLDVLNVFWLFLPLFSNDDR
jgi:FtsH-binding integral membrane protein